MIIQTLMDLLKHKGEFLRFLPYIKVEQIGRCISTHIKVEKLHNVLRKFLKLQIVNNQDTNRFLPF
jgi:hypothetical protein